MKPLGELSEVELSAIKNFVDYWNSQKKTFAKGIISNKRILRRIRRNTRIIYISGYIHAYQDFAMEFAKDTLKNINDDLEELHNLFPN